MSRELLTKADCQALDVEGAVHVCRGRRIDLPLFFSETYRGAWRAAVDRDLGGSVYFAVAGDYTKIGSAIYPARRVQAIQGCCPIPVELAATITTGGRFLERWLHEYFAAHRGLGEWFTLPTDWREELDAVAVVIGLRGLLEYS